MSEVGARAGALARRVERIGLLAILGAVGFRLYRSHSVVLWDEPAAWLLFGRDFSAGFGETPLAYGFPLVVSGAVELVGPALATASNGLLLLALTLALYGFARDLASRSDAIGLAPVAGGACVALWLHGGSERLAGWVAPGPEILGASLALFSARLWLRFQREPGASPGWAIAAGALLGLAVGTHEAALWLLLPLALSSLAREGRPLPGLPGLGAGLALGCLPMLLHGHFSPERLGAPSLGGPEALLRVLFAVYGASLAWVAAGIALAARRPREPALSLCGSALLLALFAPAGPEGSASLRAGELFALPLAGFGVAELLRLALGWLGTGWPARSVASALGLAAAGLASAAALQNPRFEPAGMRVEDALALRDHFQALGREAGPILAEPPLSEILRCLLDEPGRVHALALDQAVAGNGGHERPRVAELLGEAPEATLVFLRPALRKLAAGGFSSEPLATFRASTYGLEQRISERFSVERLVPWTARSTQLTLHPSAPGRQVVAVDVGSLSSQPRDYARLLWNDTLLDARPRDGSNFYTVDVADAARPAVLRLSSDAPVPAVLDARLLSLSEPLRLRFDPSGTVDHRERLSDSFFEAPGEVVPWLRGRGTVEVPTVDWRGAGFVMIAEVGVRAAADRKPHPLTIGARGRPYYRMTLRPGEDAVEGNRWSRISFALHEPVVTGDQTRVELDWDGEGTALALRWIEVYRLELEPTLRLEIGAEGDVPHLVQGFQAPEARDEPEPLQWRWTSEQAELRLLVEPDGRPKQLVIRSLEGARPEGLPPPAPSYRWNGEPLPRGRRSQEEVGAWRRVTETIPLPTGAIFRPINHLGIRARGFTPESGSPNARPLGVMLDEVRIEDAPG